MTQILHQNIHLHTIALRDMLRPIVEAAGIDAPAHPLSPVSVESSLQGEDLHIELWPSREFVDWRDQVVALIRRSSLKR